MTERILKMPRLGETMEEGKIVGFLVQPGESFKRGDSIIEIETDKTVAEFPALGDGKILEWIGVLGDHVVVGADLARIDIGDAVDWTGGSENEPSSQLSVDTSTDTEVAPLVFKTTDLPMPRLGETMEEGRLIRWHKSAGDSFVRGDTLLEIETDKTVAEFPALENGKIVEILRSEGDMVTVGDPIARIEVAADVSVINHKPEEAVPAVTKLVNPAHGTAQQTRDIQRIRATPLARKLARQNSVNIATIKGSGRFGRVEKSDVLQFIAGTQERGEIKFAELESGRVAYLDDGPKNGRIFLLLHGFSGDRTTWTTIASGLKRSGYRVIVPDLPAHGRTTINAVTLADLSAFLPEFLENLALEHVNIVAHSLGAVAAVSFAAQQPDYVASLTLIAPAGLGSQIDASFITGMAYATSGGEISHLLRRVVAKPADISSALAAEFAEIMSKGRLKELADAVVGVSGQRADILAELEKLSQKIPVKVLFGTQDRIIPWEQIASLPPAVSVHLLAQSGHMPQWDQTKEVLSIIKRVGGDNNE